MKVKLARDSRIMHRAGEIVEVSSAEAQFLISVGSAVECRAEVAEATPASETPKTTRRKTTTK